MAGICLIPVNLYGPADNLDLETSDVILALIRKCVEATERDAAKAIVAGAERYEGAEPVNVGTGEEISIRDLAELIAKLTGARSAFRWNRSKPDGQPRRALDVSRGA